MTVHPQHNYITQNHYMTVCTYQHSSHCMIVVEDQLIKTHPCPCICMYHRSPNALLSVHINIPPLHDRPYISAVCTFHYVYIKTRPLRQSVHINTSLLHHCRHILTQHHCVAVCTYHLSVYFNIACTTA